MVTTEIINIDPAKAESLLENNYFGQRRVSNYRANGYAISMSEGRFESLNGQTIVVSRDGCLIDGQHRMQAIINSGVTLPFIVVTVDDPEDAFFTIDSGWNRSAASFINKPHSSDLAAVSKRMYCLMVRKSSLAQAIRAKYPIGKAQASAQNDEVLKFYQQHENDIDRSVLLARRLKKMCTAPSIIACAFFYIMQCENASMLDQFTRSCSDPDKRTPLTTRFSEKIRSFGDASLPDKDLLFGATIDTYRRFCDEKTKLGNRLQFEAAAETAAQRLRQGGGKR